MEFSGRSMYFVLILCRFLTLSPSLCDKIHERDGFIATKEIHVALILDMESWAGRVFNTCISIAVSDFYASNAHYKTRLVLHTRDSKGDTLHALSQVSLLMESIKLEAIVVGDTSSSIKLLAQVGGRARVPVLSLSQASHSLPSSEFPYLIQIKEDDNHLVAGITSIIETFNWRDIILIYEDDSYGRAFLSNMMSSAQELKIRVSHTIAIPTSSTYAQVNEQLKKLMTLKTTVYVVHLSSFDLASQVFLNAQKHGLLTEGYVWIATYVIMNYLSLTNSSVLETMQGVVGFKSYFPPSNQLTKFNSRWIREFLIQNQDFEVHEPCIYGLWMYDTMRALALAAERTATRHYNEENLEGRGFLFRNEILHSKFTGISGEFHLGNGSLLNRRFQIVNIMLNGGRRVGYWSPETGITSVSGLRDSNTARKLEVVVWPGGSVKVPTGWTLHGKKLRVGVPVNSGFKQLISLRRDASTNATIVTGFCIDVFRAALETLDYEVPYELIPFENADGQMAGSYTDLINQVVLQRYDAVVGDTTITYNRSAYVDFTVPYTDPGVGMVVRKSNNNNMWVFLKPLTKELWIITAAFFVFTGFVIWLIEHPSNEEFRPVSMILWYSLSTIVFSHREKLVSDLSNFVVAVWVFFVLVLSSSYTATLASMFTVQQIHLSKGDYIGYHSSAETVSNINFDDSRLKPFTSMAEMSDVLSRGSKNGGVSAIVDEIPYLKSFVAQYYSAGYIVIRQKSYTYGFGFVFSKGSPLVGSMSRAILKLREEKKLEMLEDGWFKSGSESNPGLLDSSSTGSSSSSSSLNLANFGGLFLVTGVSSTSALIIFSVAWLYRKFQHTLGLYATRCVDAAKLYFNKILACMRQLAGV